MIAVFRRQLPALLVVFGLAIVSVTTAAATDIVFGGEARVSGGVTTGLEPFAAVELAPELAVFTDSAELRSSGLLLYRSGYPPSAQPRTLADLDELHLRLFPADWASLDMGLQRHPVGAALLLSPLNFISPVNPDLSAADDLPQTYGAALLFGGTVFFGDSYVSAFVSPAPDPISLTDMDFIPTDPGFISELTDPTVSSATLTRQSFSPDPPLELPDPLTRSSIEVAAGFPAGPADLTVVYYHGVDRVPTILATVDTASAATGQFILRPYTCESLIDAFGLSAQGTAGPALFWFDGAWTLARTFGTTELVPAAGTTVGTPGVYQTNSVSAPHLELVAGGLIQIGRSGLTVTGEYRHGFIGSDREDIIRLDFPGTALLSARWEFLDGLFNARITALALIPDRSSVLLASLSISPSSELEVRITAPFFVAPDGSLLAGVKQPVPITAGFSFRF